MTPPRLQDGPARLPAALLLDLDGTLVDSEPVHRAAYRAFFARRGWEATDLTQFSGRRAQDVFASTPGPWAGCDPAVLATEVAACTPYDLVPRPVAGAQALVEAAARHGVPVAVVTSAGRTWADRVLDEVLGLRQLVDVLVTSEDVATGKPDPAGFALACTQLAAHPARSVAVEDSPAGILAARRADVGRVHGLATTHSAAVLLAAGADAVHDDHVSLAHRLDLGV